MKFWRCFLFLFVMSQASALTLHAQKASTPKMYAKDCRPEASSTFSAVSPANPYDIFTQPFPNFVSLSANRNSGFKDGNITLTSGGLKIREKGTYSVTFSALLINNDPLLNPPPYIPLFLACNGQVNILNPSCMNSEEVFTFGGVPYGYPVKLQGSGIIKVTKGNTTLTLVASNTGSGMIPIAIGYWNIAAFKISSCIE